MIVYRVYLFPDYIIFSSYEEARNYVDKRLQNGNFSFEIDKIYV